MALINAVDVTYAGRHSVGAFVAVASENGAGWEAVNDPAELLKGLPTGTVLDHVRTFVPAPKGGEPLAGIDLKGQFAVGPDGVAWDFEEQSDGKIVAVFQMLAADTDDHIFFVEYGRRHSRTR